MTALTWEIVDAIATDLGASAAQRRKWRQTGRQVPDSWRIRIIDDLAERGVEVKASAFDDLPPRPGRLDVHAAGDIPARRVAAPGKRRIDSPPGGRGRGNG
ncbi:hypothetical protein [Sphingomonas sp. Leaf4]|uniref:hypothetical protein n=1 Tax=Sphingomonas sp. Leaf4 TaxID=2876553 RepID=UPI001E398A4C|nr:hypothetical protein [Sphingomonas sp. Leaf4]